MRPKLCSVFILLTFFTGFFIFLSMKNFLNDNIKSSHNHTHGKDMENYDLRFEPIDVVYTWVNGSDPNFLKNLKHAMHYGHVTEAQSYRFDDKYELKFSLRSLEKYAPWIRHVYIVTNGQIPYWLNLDYEKVSIVTHEEIFEDTNNLPTFSSTAIEANLHRIPNLSKHFLYFNDDIFLNNYIYLEDFVTQNNGYKIYLSWPLPNCNDECPWIYIHDGLCDVECNIELCLYDGFDCLKSTPMFFKPDNEEQINESTSKRTTLKPIELSHEMEIPRSFELKQNKTKLKIDHNDNISETIAKYNLDVMKREKNLRKHFMHTDVKAEDNFDRDAYAMSLIFVNNLYNIKYKFESRKAIAHMPIFLNKDILFQLQNEFRDEFRSTIGNKFRTSTDMQFGFAYSYFIINYKINVSTETIFDYFDTDESGTWSDREIRTLLTRLYNKLLDYDMVNELEKLLVNCSKFVTFEHKIPSTPLYERYLDSTLPLISKELVTKCHPLTKMLLDKYGYVNNYKYELVKNAHNDYVSFKMLTSNLSHVVGNLDEVRRVPKKFVCLNDNMDGSRLEENKFVETILNDFYLSLLPKSSKFELPTEFRNRFDNIYELRDWTRSRYLLKIFVYIFISILSTFIMCTLCRMRICNRLKRLFFIPCM